MPITDSFCFIPHIKNVDTRGNKSFQKDKEKKNQQFLPFISAFQKWRMLGFQTLQISIFFCEFWVTVPVP